MVKLSFLWDLLREYQYILKLDFNNSQLFIIKMNVEKNKKKCFDLCLEKAKFIKKLI